MYPARLADPLHISCQDSAAIRVSYSRPQIDSLNRLDLELGTVLHSLDMSG